MRSTSPRKTGAALVAGAMLLAAPPAAEAAVVSPELARAIVALGPSGEVPIIVELADRLDPKAFSVRDRRLRDNRLLVALRDKAAESLPPLRSLLETLGARAVRELWIMNGIAATVPVGAVAQLAAQPGLRSIRLDQVVQSPITAQATSATPEWNIGAIRAPDLWSLGFTGAGVVVAGMDSGVDPAHPDLVGKWRGGTNSWYDPYGQNASPYDPIGHGTQTMGLMVGGSAGGSAIGVAPDARWIAAKIFDDAGQGTLSAIHLAFQWLLDPDGDPATIDAPDVVNGSWTLQGGAPGSCDLEFQGDVLALEAAGIGVVFAAGNDGPAAGTSDSPANNPGGFSAGAVDSASAVASFSSRGPSACDGAIFPTLAAPGVDVWTSDLSWGGFPSYAVVSGTSFAAPHVAGAMALLAAAAPAASVAELKSALVQGALDLGQAGADNTYGHGLADVAAAYGLLAAGAGSPPTITSTPVTTATEGSLYIYQVTATDPEGAAITFSLDTAPAGMTIGASSGFVTWTPGATQVGSHPVVVRATDGSGLASTQSFSVTVAPVLDPPVASNDGYSATAGVVLNVAAPGVLANDSDPDGDPLTAVLASGPAHGTLTLGADGSFAYTASAGFAGTDSFTYTASDGQLASNPATVTLTVVAPNQAPVAANDAFTAPYRRTTSYTPQILGVLANDGDPDGSLVASSVRIVSAPSKGGTATVNANGTVSYTPKLRFKGTETFTYDVKDDRGATSNVATVTVNVK
jgi:VCBS repeat-containing protein